MGRQVSEGLRGNAEMCTIIRWQEGESQRLVMLYKKTRSSRPWEQEESAAKGAIGGTANGTVQRSRPDLCIRGELISDPTNSEIQG